MKKNIFLALKREGVPINDRYENIHTLPLFKKKKSHMDLKDFHGHLIKTNSESNIRKVHVQSQKA